MCVTKQFFVFYYLPPYIVLTFQNSNLYTVVDLPILGPINWFFFYWKMKFFVMTLQILVLRKFLERQYNVAFYFKGMIFNLSNMLLSNLIAINWKTNASLSRPTTSSSVYMYNGESSLWGAQQMERWVPQEYIFNSHSEMSPWLKVQLIGFKMITFVRVYNRRDAGC